MTRLLLITLLSVGFALRVSADVYSSQTYSGGFQNAGAIPDGSLNGWSDTRTVTGAGIHHLADVQVSLTISNGYAGDLYAYLVHGNGLAVLLNRVGMANTNAFGYADPGLDITLSAGAANDVHFYQNFSPSYNGDGWPTGTWQPDARGIDPLSAPTAFDPAGTANFDAFVNQDPNGEWTLFVADVSAGAGQSTVIRWGLQINSTTEPATNLVITSVNSGVAPTAGLPFPVVIQAQDVNGVAANVTADTVLTLSLKSGDGILGGTLTGTLTHGTSTVTLTSVTYSKAQSGVALTATHTSGNDLAPGDSSNFVVDPGSFAQLQVLMPGETAAPGSVTGKAGTPGAQTVAIPFTVTVNAVDANWNLLTTNDTVHITSSDGSAVLAPDAALSGGAGLFSLTFFSAGSQTVTASEVTHTAIAPNTGSTTAVNPGDQTITFASPGNQVYSVAPITLTATASSGLMVGCAVTAGPATVNGNTLTLTGAGSVTVQALQGGNANWNAATPVSRTFTVDPRSLAPNITAHNKAYDGNTSATVASRTLTGVINGDAVSLTGGTATFDDQFVGASKTVTATGLSLSGADAGKYVLTSTSATTTADITPGAVARLTFTTQPGLASAGAMFGQQPVVKTQDQYGNDSTVGLAANLTVTIARTSGTGPLQGTTTLDIGASAGNGTGSFTNLRIDPAGDKQLTASASGLTAAVSATFNIANLAPVASTAAFPRPCNVPLKILISDLLTNASDLNGDALSLVSVSASSTNGAPLYTNATYVLYGLPPGGNVSDSFTYTVSDGSLTASGTVLITMQADSIGTDFNVVAYGVVNGKPTITFAGVPGYTYKVQRTQDLSGTPIWTDLLSTNAPPAGLFQFVDQNPPVGDVFYRASNL